MNYLYNKHYFPPIPVIPIRLSVDGKSPMTDYLTALIDTGADFTIIPVTYLITL